MAFTISKAFFSLLASVLFFSGVHGEIRCEQLDRSTCAFAVSSSGYRCVLENQERNRLKEYVCRSSGVAATGVEGWIETDGCVEACGLDRSTVGISSDCLVDRRFKQRLCSSKCYDRCPNVVDLYASVAAGEGVSLSKLCEEKPNRREMHEINSSGEPNADASESPEGAPAYGRKLYGWDALAPQAGRKLIAMGDGEDEAAAPV